MSFGNPRGSASSAIDGIPSFAEPRLLRVGNGNARPLAGDGEPSGHRNFVSPVTDELRVLLKARFEGVGLTIEKGFIVAVDAGHGAAQAELRYRNTKLVGGSTGWVELPARQTLHHPVQIGG